MNWGITVLQTVALPLGYGTDWIAGMIIAKKKSFVKAKMQEKLRVFLFSARSFP